MTAYYNEFDPYAAQWLRNLIAAGHIAPGVVDERSIQDVTAGDLAGFTQCHFFAGIGVWSLALRRAGWPDDRPVWTMSCPCQPFSAAGAGAGFDDERHLWPDAFHIITQCTPAIVFGEQVASKPVEPWVDLVHADLEALGYAFGCVPFPSAGVGAPHIRDRAYWVADSNGQFGRQGGQVYGGRYSGSDAQAWSGIGGGILLDLVADSEGFGFARQRRCTIDQGSGRTDECLTTGRLAYANGGDAGAEREQCGGQQRQQPEDGRGLLGVAESNSERLNGFDPLLQWEKSRRIAGASLETSGRGPVNGFWGGADWISCRDDRFRPVEPGTFPLANGAPSRVGRLRAYGNAINAEAATQFILAYLEQPQVIYLTPFDTVTLACTGASTDSGFTTLDEVRQMMGEPDMAHPRMLTYRDSCFTDFVLHVEAPN